MLPAAVVDIIDPPRTDTEVATDTRLACIEPVVAGTPGDVVLVPLSTAAFPNGLALTGDWCVNETEAGGATLKEHVLTDDELIVTEFDTDKKLPFFIGGSETSVGKL